MKVNILIHKKLVRVTGIEPTSRVWKTHTLAVVLYPQVQTFQHPLGSLRESWQYD